MALVECKECRQMVSDSAYFCPKCGYVRKQIWLENTGKIYKLSSFILGLVSGLFYFVSYNPIFFSKGLVSLSGTLKGVLLVLAGMFYVAGVISWKMKLKTD